MRKVGLKPESYMDSKCYVIKTIDHFFYSDLWDLLNREGQSLEEIAIEPEENSIDATLL